ncbi:uncharacterized protein [Argopecten irradians]
MPVVKRKSTEGSMAKKPSLRRDTTLSLEPTDESPPSSPDPSFRHLSFPKRSSKKSRKRSLSKMSSKTSLKRKASLVSEGSGVYSSVTALESGSSVGKTGSLRATSIGKDCDLIPLSTSRSKKASVGTASDAVAALRKSVSELKESSLGKEPSLGKVASLSKRKSSIPSDTSSSTSPPLPPGGLIEIAISFDTTGSMYGCLEEVRGRIQDMVQRLQADIPGIRIAVIAHGDYCDASNYIIKWIDFGATVPELCDFVKTVSRTGGGDADECYELVLRRAREVLSWTPGSQRSLVVIGDCRPHEVGYKYGDFVNDINWRVEAKELNNMGVRIYSVCVNARSPLSFYQHISNVTGGRVISLAKFGVIFDILMSICYKESGSDLFEAYEAEVREKNKGKAMDTTLDGIFSTLGDGKSGFAGPSSAFGSGPGVAAPFTAPGFGTFGPIGTATKVSMARPKKSKLLKSAKAEKIGKAGKLRKTSETAKKIRKRTKSGGLLYRESLTDTKFTTGPLKRLMWSKWMVGITKTSTASPGSKLVRRDWCDGYCNAGILESKDVVGVPAVYEFGVRLSGKRKIYPVFYKVTTGVPKANTWFNYLLSKKRSAVKEVLNSHAEVMVRKGQFKRKGLAFIQRVSQLMPRKYDYAWVGRRDRKMKARNLKRCRVRISSDSY